MPSACALLLAVVPAGLTGGCLSPAPGAIDDPLVLAPPEGYVGADAEEFFFALAETTFKRSFFEIERVDRTYGEVVTKAIVGQSDLEFWRRDAVGVRNWLESTFHRLRRSVVARIKARPDGSFEVSMRSLTERYSNPTARVNSPGEQINNTFFLRQNALTDFVSPSQAAAGGMQDPEGGAWQDLGRDPKLEDKLRIRFRRHYLAEIKRLSAPAAAPAAPDAADPLAPVPVDPPEGAAPVRKPVIAPAPVAPKAPPGADPLDAAPIDPPAKP